MLGKMDDVTGDVDVGVWDILTNVTKSSGQGFDKVYNISIISKSALTHLLNVNIGRKLRSVLGVGDTYIDSITRMTG
jgi:hypothetical protein